MSTKEFKDAQLLTDYQAELSICNSVSMGNCIALRLKVMIGGKEHWAEHTILPDSHIPIGAALDAVANNMLRAINKYEYKDDLL